MNYQIGYISEYVITGNHWSLTSLKAEKTNTLPTVAISAQYIGEIVNSMPALIPQKILPA